MKLAGLSVLFGAALCGAAWAQEIPRPGGRDPTMRTQPYRSDSRIQIVGTMRRSTTITFGAEESVVQVIFGDDEIWEGPDPTSIGSRSLRNHLPLWPKKPGRTNIQVITAQRGKPDRIYHFVTVVRETPPDGADDPEATYGLTFTYPDDRRAEAQATARATASTRRAEAQRQDEMRASDRLQTARVFRGELTNWRYIARGDFSLAPTEVADDGRETALRFPGNRQVPAIFVIGDDGTEQATPFVMTRDGELLVVQRTAREFRLRLGGAVLQIYNVGFDPVGSNPGTGTNRPDVVRELRRGTSQ